MDARCSTSVALIVLEEHKFDAHSQGAKFGITALARVNASSRVPAEGQPLDQVSRSEMHARRGRSMTTRATETPGSAERTRTSRPSAVAWQHRAKFNRSLRPRSVAPRHKNSVVAVNKTKPLAGHRENKTRPDKTLLISDREVFHVQPLYKWSTAHFGAASRTGSQLLQVKCERKRRMWNCQGVRTFHGTAWEKKKARSAFRAARTTLRGRSMPDRGREHYCGRSRALVRAVWAAPGYGPPGLGRGANARWRHSRMPRMRPARC